MSKFIEEVGNFFICRNFEYTQFDNGYCVRESSTCEQVAYFKDDPHDEDGDDAALEQAREWCSKS